MCVIAGDRQPFALIASDVVPNLNLYSADATKYAGLYQYDTAGNRHDNITDWALKQFTDRYNAVIPAKAGIQCPEPTSPRQKKKPLDSRLRGNDGQSAGNDGQSAGNDRAITKEAIFHYCYAVLHDPLYREKYAQNLKREFPRIPFYAHFWQWADWARR